ncbi:adenosylcobinamide kinase/adenosylcobinamide-phosphate guanylyltransferase [Desulfobaculum xiamenense]|uniref:Adenosylcobinamide kinase n=1 Tax=Desulfobaculum xiamenense TaxID=995050 RepID=A0A846QPM1_9BACT|nr:bifunctional adenosylcobinamide kinase/adenosylcobinamide-phosphate guanylyltransferase [Desulfobaculum xiamenense]NJB69127.1 adenosylcobinamide kinase/adenosylcobinamide-phosphate guanylyltransferase [Desulfobaculum xiamenense]
MTRKIFVTGGCRSGKSAYAQRFAEAAGPRRAYLATSQALDDEMRERIRIHQDSRGEGWRTVEEPLAVAETLAAAATEADVVLLDCITLWITNCLMADMDDAKILARADELADAIAAAPCAVAVVSNEVGSGIVPDNALARRFRDLAGAVNQRMATQADTVILCVSGIPLAVKGSLPL